MSGQGWGRFGGVILILLGCANMRAPEGGPPDNRPPTLKRWRTSVDRKGRRYYKLRWSEFLDPSGEALPTLVWINPAPSDTIPPIWRRIRGKRLIVRVPASEGSGMIWLGPGLRDFTEKNPVSPMPLLPDSPSCVIHLKPPPSPKHPIWLLLRGNKGIYRFLAQGDSVRIASGVDSLALAYAFEDVNGNAIWDGLTEAIWLPTLSEKALTHNRWIRLLLDTFPPRPTQTRAWGPYALLSFSEPVQARGAFHALAENVLLALDTSLALSDSLGYTTFWRKPEMLSADTTPTSPPLFWSWSRNSQSPWILLSTPDTAVRRDTFLHLRLEKGDSLVGTCQERYFFYVEAGLGFGEATLIRSEWRDERLPLRKAPILLRADSGSSVKAFRVYPAPVLGNSSSFLAQLGDTLWLVPGRYGVAPANEPPPHISLQGRWPHLAGTPLSPQEIVVRPVDSLQVFLLSTLNP